MTPRPTPPPALAPRLFISCDWGTTAFRLRLLEVGDAPGAAQAHGGPAKPNVYATLSTGAGIAATHTAWVASGLPPTERVAFYREVLEKALCTLAPDLHGVPVIISGMASSSIGMLELPYHPLPFDMSGVGLQPAVLPPTAASPRTVYLLPGVRSADDVMRGEETQLVGCGVNPPGERVFVFPGTHSKHVIVRNGRVVDFKTYMTGEVFHLLARQSILAGSVAAPGTEEAPDPAAGSASPQTAGDGSASPQTAGGGPASPQTAGHAAGRFGPVGPVAAAGLPPAFFAGVAAARESGLLHNAFLARTNHLFNKYGKEDNYHFLSGLLIGEELVELAGHPREKGGTSPSRQFRPITLVASSPLREAYAAALAHLGASAHTVIDADQALITGHCAMMTRFGATIAPESLHKS